MNSRLKRIVKRKHHCDLYLSVREALGHSSDSKTAGTSTAIAVTSSAPREGKTYVALSMAVQAAESDGQRTLLIDAGARNRTCAARILGNGAVDQSSTEPAEDDGCLKTPIPSLDLLRWQHQPGEPLPGETLGEVVERLRSRYDLIIIDAISMSDGPRALGLLRGGDRILFVVEHRRLSAPQIKSYLTQIKSPEILGVVINKRRYPIPGFLYSRL